MNKWKNMGVALLIGALALTACSGAGTEAQDGDSTMQQESVTEVTTTESTDEQSTQEVSDAKEGAEQEVSTKNLEIMIKKAEDINPDYYENSEILTQPLTAAKALLEQKELTREAVDAAYTALQTAYEQLDDGFNLTDPIRLTYVEDINDPYKMMDGTLITKPDEWPNRAEELTDMYQYYMYGMWRDGSDEEVTYDYSNNKLTIHIKRLSTGAQTSFTATVGLPDKEKTAPEGGYPVVVGMHAGISEDKAHENGFATITLDGFGIPVASDDTKHIGAFYDLYPYGSHWKEQTGVLMAWGWGCSKILDALEVGAGKELNIDGTNSIVTGVSRWGKATIVCGAFDKRFRMVAPSCSGAGGTALFRYTSEGNTYDFTSKGGPAAYTYTQNEPLGSLQAMGERGWFNNRFLSFKSVKSLPFDQHLLSSLVAAEDRYLFIIGSCVSEDWVNAPAMWFSYLATKEIYDFLDISENIKINIHKEGHAVIPEDMEYMTQYFNQMVYGITPESDLSVLDTSVFALDVNKDPIWDSFTETWTVK